MASIECRVHEACIEVARRSTTVYKVGVAYIGIVCLVLLVLHILMNAVTRTHECFCSHMQVLPLATCIVKSKMAFKILPLGNKKSNDH